ncbi:hypothetical protein [Nocardia aurea]|uniref:hypothetical protein n=3 Tax=Nocardia TaxID=1817 RepID=UPI000D696730|nr:hypothetical protein [Nocardia aurea]
MTTAANALTVDDVTTDKHILVARIAGWTEHNGYRDRAETFLAATGLAGLMPSARRPFTVTLDELATHFTEPASIFIYTRTTTPDRYDVAEATRNYIDTHVSRFLTTIENGTLTAQPTDHGQTVDIEAVTTTWGKYDTRYPEAGSPEVSAFRHSIIRTFIEHAISAGHCKEVESTLRRIGLGAYLPPETKQITVTVPGFGTITETIQLTRTGDVTPELLRDTVSRHIAAKLCEADSITYVDTPAS